MDNAKQGLSLKRLGKYWIVATLGQGSYSKVKLGIDSETGKRVAIKIASRQGDQVTAIETAQDEMRVYRDMRSHVNVIGYIESGKKYYFSQKSEQLFKAKLVHYIVVELAA